MTILITVELEPKNETCPHFNDAMRRAEFRELAPGTWSTERKSSQRESLDEASCKVGELMQAHGLTARPYELTITASAAR